MRLTKADREALKRLQRKKDNGSWDGSAQKYYDWLQANLNRKKKAS